MAFDIPDLSDGVELLSSWRWACSALPKSCAFWKRRRIRAVVNAKLTGLMPTLADIKVSYSAILRGTRLGSVLSTLPGGGAVITAFAAYTLEKHVAGYVAFRPRRRSRSAAAPKRHTAAAQTSLVRCARSAFLTGLSR